MQRADRVKHLLAPAVADGECHVRSGGALPGRLYCLFQRAGGAAGQHVECARDMDLSGGRRPGQPDGDDVFDDLHEERDLGVTAPLQVLRGAQEHGHVPDPGPLAPVQDIFDVLGPVLVPRLGLAIPICRAQRRLPSMISPTCLGSVAPDSSLRSLREYRA